MSVYDEVKIGLARPDLHSTIQIAIANIPVLEGQIKASYLRRPVLTRPRLKQLTTLLNNISKYHSGNDKIDMVIFPEVSIPYAWEPIIVSWARKHNIGVICGLEHRVNRRNIALNEILAALPYNISDHHKGCLPLHRLKRIYSPKEITDLRANALRIPKQNKNARDPYQLIRWRGASFAIYNCFELTCIEDRSLFKGKVDFLVAIECNRDVNYFSSIVESTSRDLHCYIIQVNDPEYGDSRIVSPSKLEVMNPLRIKGGVNTTFLTMKLDLKALRKHQLKNIMRMTTSDKFKHIPPGFSRADLMTRINYGRTSVGGVP